jgi:hypothetical protein
MIRDFEDRFPSNPKEAFSPSGCGWVIDKRGEAQGYPVGDNLYLCNPVNISSHGSGDL